MDNLFVFIALRPKKPGVISKVFVEIGKIAAIGEITERAEVTGSQILTVGGQTFEVKEKPEEVINEATRLINRALDQQIMK